MNALGERSRSVWMDTRVGADEKPLSGDSSADVIIVGAGIAGLSVGYELTLRGISVVILDRGPIAGGMTARTTAHLTPICDDSLSSLLSVRGQDAGRGFVASHGAAIDRIEAIQKALDLDCDFRRLDGVLFLDPDSDVGIMEDEHAAATELRVEVFRGQGLPISTLEDRPYLRYPNQATFHPLKYVRGLARAITAKGGRLHPLSPVTGIEEDGPMVVATLASGHRVRAPRAVIATNSPIYPHVVLQTKLAPYRTYAMGFEIPRGAINAALYWDTADPYHYVRLTPGPDGNDILIVGGADHKTGEADDPDQRFEHLASWIRTLVPRTGGERYRWSGQVLETLDYSAYIGRVPGSDRIFVATGDSGQGMTHGAIAGLLLADLIEKKENPYEPIYDPARKSWKSTLSYVNENLTAVRSFMQYVAPGERASADELQPGEGAIIRNGITKVAAYRAPDGALYQRSAACSHIGCHLHWNSFECCWDCPCHGSHFAPDGSVLHAPAIFPLAEIGKEE